MYFTYQVKKILRDDEYFAINKILKQEGLKLEKDVDSTYGVFHNGEIIGTGSLKTNILMSIAIARKYRGTEAINILMSHLINTLYAKGKTHQFIFTKPDMAKSFVHFGFSVVEATDSVVLMEQPHRYNSYLNNLTTYYQQGSNGAIVMNANPFTKGHLYLVEYAVSRCNHLYVFVVSEDASVFEESVRLNLVKAGTSHLQNVSVIRGGPYIVSKATFPAYFLGNKNLSNVHGELDLKIFGKGIAPQLNIVKRFVGSEPYCSNTSAYNQEMKLLLGKYGVELVEIERAKFSNQYISASTVRQAIIGNDLDMLRNMLPPTTMDYLNKERINYYRRQLKNRNGRH